MKFNWKKDIDEQVKLEAIPEVRRSRDNYAWERINRETYGNTRAAQYEVSKFGDVRVIDTSSLEELLW